MEFSDLLERFLTYVGIDTQSDEHSITFPSTEKQLDLARWLKDELTEMGLEEVELNRWGYVFATLRTNRDKDIPTVALIAHMDTSPDISGTHVSPRIFESYDGKDIMLSGEHQVVLRVGDHPALGDQVGKTLITTDGTTLLGADDKAGIAEIMSALHYLVLHPEHPRPNIRVLFTPDEEVGRGTDKLKMEEIGADFGYTVDGEKLGDIEDETFCADTMELHIQGVNVHPGYAKEKMVNALKIAAEIIHGFPKESLSPETTEKRQGYIHPHILNGAVDEARIKVLIRDFDEKGLGEKEDLIRGIAEGVTARYPGARFEVTIQESYRNMKRVLDRYPEVVEKAEEAVRRAGLTPRRTMIRGGTDGARLCFMGLPTPNLFTGGANFHSRYEWISLEDMKKASEVIVHLMGLWAEG